MKHSLILLLFAAALASLQTGCDPPKPAANAPAAAPPPPGQAPLPVETKVGVFAGGLDDLAAPVNSSPPPPPGTVSDAAPPQETETERVVAGKGVGLKGRSLDEHEGIYVTPAKTFFTAKEKIQFEIEIPHALALYKALEGEAPKSHEEFMEKVIKPNQIKLLELPPGHKYVYDPETEILMVERPKKATGGAAKAN